LEKHQQRRRKSEAGLKQKTPGIFALGFSVVWGGIEPPTQARPADASRTGIFMGIIRYVEFD
jgi:hypothetical protein